MREDGGRHPCEHTFSPVFLYARVKDIGRTEWNPSPYARMHIATAIYTRIGLVSRVWKSAALFQRPPHYTYERTSPINWIATNARCINELCADREREGERKGGREGIRRMMSFYPSSFSILHFLPSNFSFLPQSCTAQHRYIGILARSFGGRARRENLNFCIHASATLSGGLVARSVSVFDHHSLPPVLDYIEATI